MEEYSQYSIDYHWTNSLYYEMNVMSNEEYSQFLIVYHYTNS